MQEPKVEQAVKTYFTDKFPQFSIAQQCDVSFGTQHGIADVVLHQPIKDGKGYFVAIAECKKLPLPIPLAQARAQLKSYMSATNTRYGVLAVGTDPRHWEFCENKYNNWFALINRETFEQSVENWKPIFEQSEVNLLRGRKAVRWWKRIALAFALAFLISCVSVFLLWRKPPPEPVVYITRTGEKYHTYDCDFLRKFATEKFAILLDKAEKDYDPCRICYSIKHQK